MADSWCNRDDLAGNLKKVMMRDIDGTCFAESVYVEHPKSSKVTVTKFQNATLDTLVSAVNAHLAASTKQLKNIHFMTSNIVSVVYFAIVTEVTP